MTTPRDPPLGPHDPDVTPTLDEPGAFPPPAPPPGSLDAATPAVPGEGEAGTEPLEAPRRRRRAWTAVRWLVAWLVPAILVGALTAAAVDVTLSERTSSSNPQLTTYQPLDLGTTWVYRDRADGKPAGLTITQVTGTALSGDLEHGVTIESQFTNFLGQGSAFHVVAYAGVDGRRIVTTGHRYADSFHPDNPPSPALVAPLRAGRTWRYEGLSFDADTEAVTTVVRRGTVMVAGRRFTDCLLVRSRTTSTPTTTTNDQPPRPSTTVTRSWMCPGVGEVEHHEVTTGANHGTFDSVLAEFHGVTGNIGTGRALGDLDVSRIRSEPGEDLGIDPGRSQYVDGTLDLSRFAWTYGRHSSVLYPPVGAGDLVILAEDDGTVSALDTRDGSTPWQVMVTQPVVASPVVAGPVVLVADGNKSLLALDLRTGYTRWALHLPDVVSATPVVVGDRAVVPIEDRTIRAVDLADGGTLWTAETADLVAQPLALAAGNVVAVDDAGGLTAYDPSDGSVVWSAAANDVGAQFAAGRGVVVANSDTLEAFDARDGSKLWREEPKGTAGAAAAIGPDFVAVVADHFVEVHDLATGRIRWARDTGGPLSQPVVVVGDRLVALRDDAVLVTYDEEGNELQRLRLRGPKGADIDIDAPMSVAAGALVVTANAAGPWPFRIAFAFPIDGRRGPDGVSFLGSFRQLPTATSSPADLSHDHVYVSGGFDNKVYDLGPDGRARVLATSDGTVPFAFRAGAFVLTQIGDKLAAVPAGGGEPAWTFPMGPPQVSVKPAVAGGVVVVPQSGVGLAGVDLETGSQLWSLKTPGAAGLSTPLALRSGDVVYAGGGLRLIDPSTGAVRWTVKNVEAVAGLAEDGGSIFVEGFTDQGLELLAVDEGSGKVVWRVPFNAAISIGPAASDGIVAAADPAGATSAFDARTGKLLWTRPARTPLTGGPAFVDGVLVLQEMGRAENIIQRDYRLTAVDPRTGGFLAQWELPGASLVTLFAAATPFGAKDGTILAPGLGGTSAGAIYLLRPVGP